MPKIGSGPNSSENATYDESKEAMEDILDGGVKDATLGAFWLANRWKRNNPEELAGFLDAVLEDDVERVAPDVSPVDCGANYDGKSQTAVLGVASGLVAAAAETPVVVHSGDRIPTQKDPCYKQVLANLGIETDISPKESAETVDDVGFGYYSQGNFNHAIDRLWSQRDAVGVRTFLNTVETIVNPSLADVHLGSFYHLAFARKIVDTVRESRHLDFDRVIMFQGLEGYDDIRPGYTKVAEWRSGEELDSYEIETGEYGMDLEREDLEVDDIAVDSAEITEKVLAGDADQTWVDTVALNAGFRIYAGGNAETVEAGVDEARDIIRDGYAADLLSELREFEP
ncbi:MAG: anthranilate phosphoribosyltransferase [Halobacteria archaeon]